MEYEEYLERPPSEEICVCEVVDRVDDESHARAHLPDQSPQFKHFQKSEPLSYNSNARPLTRALPVMNAAAYLRQFTNVFWSHHMDCIHTIWLIAAPQGKICNEADWPARQLSVLHPTKPLDQ